jgi:hypothetical protein
MAELLFVSLVGIGSILGLVVVARMAEAAKQAEGRRTYRLLFPSGLAPEAVIHFCTGLSGLLMPVRHNPIGMEALVFEVSADADHITHRLIVPESISEAVTSQLRAALPGVRVMPEAQPPAHHLTTARELRLPQADVPLRTDEAEAASAAVLASLHPLAAGETAVMQWVVRPAAPRKQLGDDPLTVLDLLGGTAARRNAEAKRAERQKLAEPLFLAVGRVGVRTASPGRARQVLRRLVAVLHVLNAPGSYLKVRLLSGAMVARRLERRAVPLLAWPAVLNSAELAAALAFPVGTPQLPGLQLGGCRQLPPSPLLPRDGFVVAQSDYPGLERPITIAADDRAKHLAIIGPTGSGKTALLTNLISQDMARGWGVIAVALTGDLIRQVVERVPPERVDDVVLLDAADDGGRVVGFDPLAGAATEPDRAVDDLVFLLRQLHADSWGPRLEDSLRAALRTLAQRPGYGLLEVGRLFTDPAWRRQWTARLDDGPLAEYWGWFDSLSNAERVTVISPILNKVRQLSLPQRTRRLIGQHPAGLNLDQVLEQGQIALISLPSGVLGSQTAKLLASILLAQSWQAIRRRALLAPEQRRPVALHLDEVADLLDMPTSLGEMLAQARALGVPVSLATQDPYQLPPDVRSAVASNARSKLTFQCSAYAARFLAPEFAPLTVDELRGLGPYQVAATITHQSATLPPATGFTLPPPPETGRGDEVRSRSRSRYGQPAAEVEAAIRGRQVQRSTTAPVGRQRRRS